MKSIVRSCLIAALLVPGLPAIASAQMFEPIRFTTTFSFQAGQRLMPAGTYLLEPIGSANAGNLFTLENRTSRQVTFMIGDGLGASPDPKATADEVVFAFDHAAGHYVLCQVWDSSEQSGVEVHGTYDLIKAARAAEANAPAPQHDEVIVPANVVR
jgi:hypothetical protein